MAGDILPPQSLHRTALGRFKTRGQHFDWLNYRSRETVKWEDDFLGNQVVASTTRGYTSSTGTGGTAATLVANSLHGEVSVVSGGTDDSSSGFVLANKPLTADQNPTMEMRIKVSAAPDTTNHKLEVGFFDASNITSNGAMLSLSGATCNLTDGCFAIYDSDYTSHVFWFLAGTRAGTAWKSTEASAGQPDPKATPTAGARSLPSTTYAWIKVGLRRVDLATDNVDAFMWINDTLVYEKRLNAVSNTVALFPGMSVTTRGASAGVTATVDAFNVWWDRATGGMAIA